MVCRWHWALPWGWRLGRAVPNPWLSFHRATEVMSPHFCCELPPPHVTAAEISLTPFHSAIKDAAVQVASVCFS